MQPSQVFGVVVRFFGLLTWLASVAYVGSALTVILTPDYRPDARPWTHYLMAAVLWFVVGWFLLRRAERLVAFTYRAGSSNATDV